MWVGYWIQNEYPHGNMCGGRPIPSKISKIAIRSLMTLAARAFLETDNEHIDEFLLNSLKILKDENHHLFDIMPVSCWEYVHANYYDNIYSFDLTFNIKDRADLITAIREIAKQGVHIVAHLKTACINSLWFRKYVLDSGYLRTMDFDVGRKSFIVDMYKRKKIRSLNNKKRKRVMVAV